MKIWSPGKVLLYGGFTILEKGCTGLVLPVNKGVYAEISEGQNVINAPQFGVENLSFEWDDEINDKGSDEDKEKMMFVLSAIDNTLKYLKSQNKEIKHFSLKTWNDDGLTMNFGESKAGFGTSAGATVSTVVSILGYHGYDVDSRQTRELVNKIAQYTHYLVQGKIGSGFDVSSACFGPHFFERANPDIITQSKDVVEAVSKDWENKADEVEWPKFFNVLMIYTGRSASTKGAVGKVKAWRSEGGEDLYQKFIQENDNINKSIIDVWRNVSQMTDYDKNPVLVQKLKGLLKSSWAQRKVMGQLSSVDIETDEDTQLLSELEKNGALFATLPGAGGGDSIFCVCLDSEAVEKVENYAKSKDLYVFEGADVVFSGYKILN